MAYYRVLCTPFSITHPLLGAFVEKIETRPARQLGVPSIV